MTNINELGLLTINMDANLIHVLALLWNILSVVTLTLMLTTFEHRFFEEDEWARLPWARWRLCPSGTVHGALIIGVIVVSVVVGMVLLFTAPHYGDSKRGGVQATMGVVCILDLIIVLFAFTLVVGIKHRSRWASLLARMSGRVRDELPGVATEIDS